MTTTLANHWLGIGWRVTVVTIAGVEHDTYELDSRVERIGLKLGRQSNNTLTALGNNARRVMELRRVLKRLRPDVAVSMMSTSNSLLAVAGQGLKIALIGSERAYPPMVPLGRAWEAVRRWAYPKLSALVAQTEQSAEWLRKHAAAPRIVVIPNPVKYPMINQEPRLAPQALGHEFSAKRILLAVGRLTDQKGFDRLLRAYASLSNEMTNWMLVILGEGCQRAALERQAEDLGISGRVHMLGAVGNMAEWFDAADLYVLTSRFEGFPNTLLEALAHGVPVVAVDCETGPRQIVRREVDGLLVPQDDASALVGALGRLMRDDRLRTRFAERAVEVQQRFSIEVIAGLWEKLFEEARQQWDINRK